MKTLIKLWKVLGNLAKEILGIAGILFVLLLCMWSIVFLMGGGIDKAQLDLKPLVSSPTLAWIWIGTIFVSIIEMLRWLIQEIRNGIAKARDSKLDTEEKARSLFWWILKN